MVRTKENVRVPRRVKALGELSTVLMTKILSRAEDVLGVREKCPPQSAHRSLLFYHLEMKIGVVPLDHVRLCNLLSAAVHDHPDVACL